jgi:hypothetical protein
MKKSAEKERIKLKKEIKSVLDRFNRENKNVALADIRYSKKEKWFIFLIYDKDVFTP